MKGSRERRELAYLRTEGVRSPGFDPQRTVVMPTSGTSIASVLGDAEMARAPSTGSAFDEAFRGLFREHFNRLYRVLDRLSGDADLAADLAQEAFVKLYRRRALPDSPAAWLVTVALNQLRNTKSRRARRSRLLTVDRAMRAHSDPEPHAGSQKLSEQVRGALDSLPERERSLLLLRSEGYAYREMAEVLGISEASIGTLLARAKSRFRAVFGEGSDAP